MAVRPTRLLLAASLIAASVAGACSGGGDDGTPAVNGGGANVSVDADSGDLRVETEDGSFSIGTDELPEGWPEDIPLPPGHRISSAMRSGGAQDASFSVGGTFEGPPRAAFEEVVATFVANGWDEVQSGSNEVEGSPSASATFDDGTWTAVISMTSTDAGSTFAYTVVASQT